jgi:hypothetical protein
MRCSCGCDSFSYTWRTFDNGTRHIEQRCSACGVFVRWAPQRHPNGVETREALCAQEPAADTSDKRQGGLW